MKNKPYQTGLSLVEIMIALLIGLFLLGGVLQIFINSQQTYRMQENLSRLQENGRFAIDFLAHDSRMAGYWGCLSGTNTDITGVDNNAGVANIDDGTDSITLKGIFNPTLTTAVACDSPANTDPVYTDPTSTIAYTINNAALYQNTNGQNNNNALVEGIENMQILYGVDTDTPHNGANYYVPAYPALDWPNVVSIRITLTARTLDSNLTTIGDGRIRRDFTTTITLRNRLP